MAARRDFAPGDRIAPARFLLFAAAFLAAGGAAMAAGAPPRIALLTGFDVAAFLFLCAAWPLLGADPDAMRRTAARNDANRAGLLAISVLLSLVILFAVGSLITGPQALGPGAQPQQPVVNVSWFAADAYCGSQGARLPSWNEWEYAAAADESRKDARKDPVWRERILAWYSRPSKAALPRVGLQAANAYGVRDLHGLVWEWTEDYSALLVDADNRKQGDADKAKFCGAGALSMDDRENCAVLMRVAMLSALEASSTTANLGFRCAKDIK